MKDRSQSTCIFCPNKADSVEHIISEWIHPLLPRTASINSRRLLPPDKTKLATVRFKSRQGPSYNIRLKRVCTQCNTGWMSGLDTAVIPILTPLITGEDSHLGIDSQRTLATWIVLKTIMIDSYQPSVAAITKEQRYSFKATMTIPDNWLISIAHNKSLTWRAKWAHRSYTSLLPPSFVRPERANSQATTLGLGEIVVHSYNAPSHFIYSRMQEAMAPFTRLWPGTGRLISWPEAESLLDADINFLADLLKNTVGVL